MEYIFVRGGYMFIEQFPFEYGKWAGCFKTAAQSVLKNNLVQEKNQKLKFKLENFVKNKNIIGVINWLFLIVRIRFKVISRQFLTNVTKF